jgi:hypothetical protein
MVVLAVIPATQEAEARGPWVNQGKVSKTLSQKQNGWGHGLRGRVLRC